MFLALHYPYFYRLCLIQFSIIYSKLKEKASDSTKHLLIQHHRRLHLLLLPLNTLLFQRGSRIRRFKLEKTHVPIPPSPPQKVSSKRRSNYTQIHFSTASPEPMFRRPPLPPRMQQIDLPEYSVEAFFTLLPTMHTSNSKKGRRQAWPRLRLPAHLVTYFIYQKIKKFKRKYQAELLQLLHLRQMA